MISLNISLAEELDESVYQLFKTEISHILNNFDANINWIQTCKHDIEATIALSSPIPSPPKDLHELFQARPTTRKLICYTRNKKTMLSDIFVEEDATSTSNIKDFLKKIKRLCHRKKIKVVMKQK